MQIMPCAMGNNSNKSGLIKDRLANAYSLLRKTLGFLNEEYGLHMALFSCHLTSPQPFSVTYASPGFAADFFLSDNSSGCETLACWETYCKDNKSSLDKELSGEGFWRETELSDSIGTGVKRSLFPGDEDDCDVISKRGDASAEPPYRKMAKAGRTISAALEKLQTMHSPIASEELHNETDSLSCSPIDERPSLPYSPQPPLPQPVTSLRTPKTHRAMASGPDSGQDHVLDLTCAPPDNNSTPANPFQINQLLSNSTANNHVTMEMATLFAADQILKQQSALAAHFQPNLFDLGAMLNLASSTPLFTSSSLPSSSVHSPGSTQTPPSTRPSLPLVSLTPPAGPPRSQGQDVFVSPSNSDPTSDRVKPEPLPMAPADADLAVARGSWMCPQCFKIIKYKRNARAHLMSHAAVRPCFSCDHCEQSFTTKWNLKKHLKLNHGIDVEIDSRPNSAIATNQKGAKANQQLAAAAIAALQAANNGKMPEIPDGLFNACLAGSPGAVSDDGEQSGEDNLQDQVASLLPQFSEESKMDEVVTNHKAVNV